MRLAIIEIICLLSGRRRFQREVSGITGLSQDDISNSCAVFVTPEFYPGISNRHISHGNSGGGASSAARVPTCGRGDDDKQSLRGICLDVLSDIIFIRCPSNPRARLLVSQRWCRAFEMAPFDAPVIPNISIWECPDSPTFFFIITNWLTFAMIGTLVWHANLHPF